MDLLRNKPLWGFTTKPILVYIEKILEILKFDNDLKFIKNVISNKLLQVSSNLYIYITVQKNRKIGI